MPINRGVKNKETRSTRHSEPHLGHDLDCKFLLSRWRISEILSKNGEQSIFSDDSAHSIA